MKKKFGFSEKIKLYNKTIGKNFPIYFIAEIGVNHCNNIRLAKKMVIAAKKAGADAVKFQSFSAEKLVTPQTPKAKYQINNTSKKVYNRSGENTSSKSRHAYALHIIDGISKYKSSNWLQRDKSLPLRGF